jgi:hypothetical protein
MTSFDVKISITHSGITTDYINNNALSVKITGRENNISSAILTLDNKNCNLYPDNVDAFDAITIYAKPKYATTYTTLFVGTIREPNYTLNMQNEIVQLKCKHAGQALLETHANRMYGESSNNITINTIKEIIEDLVDNMVNKSYGSANVTGYAITKTYIDDIDSSLSIQILNKPYQTIAETLNVLFNIDTAYRDGSTAGPHFIIDNSGNLRVKTISSRQTGSGTVPNWGNYYGGSSTAISLYQGTDFIDYTIQKPSDEYANSIVLAANFRKPAYDSWSAPYWGLYHVTATDEDSVQIVGSSCLLFETSDAYLAGYAYYPASSNAAWNIENWGSSNSVPTLNCYCRKHKADLLCLLRMNTTLTTDYFQAAFMTYTSEADDTWYHKSIPIGPYWASSAESRAFRWSTVGSPSWTNINSLEFYIAGSDEDAALRVDDLHFSGKIIREAVDTSEVTAKHEHQKIVFSQAALDDTGIASDDSGMAGQIAYAELLRRVTLPRSITFTTELKPDLLPGEYFKIYAGKRFNSYKINGVDFRVIQYEHLIDQLGFNTTITATDDLLNSYPINAKDARSILNEYLLYNNKKATDMQSGEVDVLVPHLRKTY